jgi:hypothetical protein
MLIDARPDSHELATRYGALRLAVACLGEREGTGLWRSSFLSETGQEFSAFNFPRAPLLASWSAASTAAKRTHDERIGRSGTFHLFRVPLGHEIQIHRAASLNAGELLQTMRLSSDELMKHIEHCAGESINAPVGPVQVGSLDDAFTQSGLTELAKHYLSGFKRAAPCFPYFADKPR